MMKRILLLAIVFVSNVGLSASSTQETLLGIVGRDFVLLGADSSSSSSIALTSSHLDKIMVLQNYSSDRHCVAAVAAAGNAADADRLLGLLQAHVSLREYEQCGGSGGADVECVWEKKDKDDTSDGRHGNSEFRHDVVWSGLDAGSIANCARQEIASALRSATPIRVCLLVGGMVSVLQAPSSATGTFSGRIQAQIKAAKRQIHYNSHSSSDGSDEYMTTDIDDPLHNKQYMQTQAQQKQPCLLWMDEYGSLQRLEEYGAHGLGANFALSILDQGYRPDLTRDEALRLMKDCFDQLKIRFVINSPQPPCVKCIDKDGCCLLRF